MTTRTLDTTRQQGLTGILMERNLAPGSPEWISAGISASRIAAIMGVETQYSSRFTWWHVMAGNLPYDSTVTDIQRRGHLLEPALAQWFAEEHPEFSVEKTGTWMRRDEHRFIASPDRMLIHGGAPHAILECKSATSDAEWGVPGTGEVPANYWLQAQWLMFVLGVHRCHFAVLNGFLGFVEYVVEADAPKWQEMAREATAFLESLPGGKHYRLPPIDEAEPTYAALRKLNPLIEDGEVVIDGQTARDYINAIQQAEEWKKAAQYYKNTITDRLGPFRSAVVATGAGDDREYVRFAYRKMAKGGPSLTKVSKLPDLASIPVE